LDIVSVSKFFEIALHFEITLVAEIAVAI
jgi:hypothetical protein